MNKYLSWLAIIFGLIYFVYETWYHISYDQTLLALTADYLSVFLLVFAGSSNLRFRKGIGLLCGAWAYTFCIMYRAFIWRMEALQANELENHETFVLQVLSFALVISFTAFLISFIKSFPKKTLE